ncbi:ATP-binding protein [Mesorhizobium erdmanii]|uniref:ATP-binding protein n=1 Tax=Mesorhizobium erdmanii TaxID=1777866 RepID=UPI00041D79B6|nr:AAA family ATPase [Mesorhizobium erdmanii]
MDGEFEIDYARRELRRDGVALPLGERAFDVLALLAKADGAIVAKDQLVASVWLSAAITDSVLQANIAKLVEALDGSDVEIISSDAGFAIRAAEGKLSDLLWESNDSGETAIIRLAGGGNLPAERKILIGRSEALDELKSLLPANRALTITGPGGIGKTALAVRLAQELRSSIQDQVYFVDLAVVTDPSLVASAVAVAIGVAAGAETISPELVAQRVGAARILLVLDNCEHMAGAAAALTNELIQTCGKVWVLATSREPLQVQREHVYRLPPLAVPTADVIAPSIIYASPAPQLFVARMAESDRRSMAATSDLAPVIAGICRRLDGIPLAIEFAAARAGALGVPHVAANLDDRFRLLGAEGAIEFGRHQTLRATLDWSYDLLADVERILLRHLAVFAGGFTVEGATAVLGRVGAAPINVLEWIASLVTKSLVIQERIPGRWRLLETTRAYGYEKLTELSEKKEAQRRHAEFFRYMCSPDRGGRMGLWPPGPQNIGRLVAELDNVRTALEWCFSKDGDPVLGVPLTVAYVPVWHYLGLMAESSERCEVAIERQNPEHDHDERLLMQLLMRSTGGLGASQRRHKTHSTAAKSLEIAKRLKDRDWESRSLRLIWACHLFNGDVSSSLPIAKQLLDMAISTEDDVRIAEAERTLGYSKQMAGENTAARALFEQAIARYPPVKPEQFQWFRYNERAVSRAMLSLVLWIEGYADRAVAETRLALEEASSDRLAASQCNVLRAAVCRIEILAGNYEEASASIALLRNLSKQYGYNAFFMTGELLQGALLVKQGNLSRGVSMLRKTLDDVLMTEWTGWFPEFLAILAEGLIGMGRLNEAAAALEEGIVRAERGGEHWYLPELFRLKGELAIANGLDESLADHCFNQAAELSAKQRATSWELRIAVSRARLCRQAGRTDQGRSILESVYRRFTEGLDTADLRKARELLDAL